MKNDDNNFAEFALYTIVLLAIALLFIGLGSCGTSNQTLGYGV